METTPFTTLAQRQRAVAYATALTRGTALAPQHYERYLLTLYQRGLLTIEEVEELLNVSIYQVIYHSRATTPLTPTESQLLLEQARRYNAHHHITGLLLYSEGRYVQALEGTEADVRTLYARIQRDPRHEQIITVSEGPGPQRFFAAWDMAFSHIAAPTVDKVLDTLQTSPLASELHLENPNLQALLNAFDSPLPVSEVIPVMRVC